MMVYPYPYTHWYYTVSQTESGDPMGQDSGTVYW